MPTHCIVPYCKGAGGHRWPFNDKELSQKWLIAIRRDKSKKSKWKGPTKSTRVCHDHFSSDCYVTETFFGEH